MDELEIQQLQSEVQQLSRAAERAAIVAWLRAEADDYGKNEVIRILILAYASLIESGEHIRPG